MRAHKTQVNLSHAWFLNDGLITCTQTVREAEAVGDRVAVAVAVVVAVLAAKGVAAVTISSGTAWGCSQCPRFGNSAVAGAMPERQPFPSVMEVYLHNNGIPDSAWR